VAQQYSLKPWVPGFYLQHWGGGGVEVGREGRGRSRAIAMWLGKKLMFNSGGMGV
jgi:hypothetical protein